MVILGKKHPYAFIHIPKTGGTSVTEWLRRMEGQPLEHEGGTHIHHQEYPHRWAFAFVRNPINRWASYYKHSKREKWDEHEVPFPEWMERRIKGEAVKGHRQSALPQHKFLVPEVQVFPASADGYRLFMWSFWRRFGYRDFSMPRENTSGRLSDFGPIPKKTVSAILNFERPAARLFGFNE